MIKQKYKIIFGLISLLFCGSQFGQTTSLEQVESENFEKLHSLGLRGKGTKICIIEHGCHVDHPVFAPVRSQFEFISVSRSPEKPNGFIDESTYRYNIGLKNILCPLTNGERNFDHGTHIGALIVSTPFKYNNYSFQGGLAPDASMIIIDASSIYLNRFWQTRGKNCYGIGLYTFKDADENLNLDIEANEDFDFVKKKYKAPAEDFFTSENEYEKRYLSNRDSYFLTLRTLGFYEDKIDDSLMHAFKRAFISGARVINLSKKLAEICDPLNDYMIPKSILEEIKIGLTSNDQILVLAANNDGCNLTRSYEQVYFRQLTKINDIASRMLIVSNVCFNESQNVAQLDYSSNYPGEKLKDYTVCTFGENILSAYWNEDPHTLSKKSGTSQAAAKVSSFCLLVDEFFKSKNQPLSAPEIVTFVKKNALDLGSQEEFGCGLINPNAILELMK